MTVLIIRRRTARITRRTTATTILPVIRILITDTDRLIRIVSWLEALAPTTDITGITTTKYDELRAQRGRNFTPAALAVTLSPFFWSRGGFRNHESIDGVVKSKLLLLQFSGPKELGNAIRIMRSADER